MQWKPRIEMKERTVVVVIVVVRSGGGGDGYVK
jgi:hypothetical protein